MSKIQESKNNVKKVRRKQMKKRKENLREHGITLVALVVTIVIMLILAGVTLNLAIRR